MDAGYRDHLLRRRTSFERAISHARAEQDAIFHECVQANVDTVFGREHGFARLTTLDEYRRAVPIRTYDELAPYIERAAAGEVGVLTHATPRYFARTSGTSGAAKRIPSTEADGQRRLALRQAEEAAFVEEYPEALARTDAVLNLVLDWKPPTSFTEGGLPYVAISTWGPPPDAPVQLPPWFHSPWFRLPPEPSAYAERLYARLRLAAEGDIVFLTALNPSTLLVAAKMLGDRLAEIADDVAAGRLFGAPTRKPNVERARELARIAERGGGPADVWPRLRGISCWTAAATARYLPAVREVFGAAVTISPCGMLASEGIVTVTGYRADAADAGLLAVTAHLFEFLPLEDASNRGHTLLFHELEVGRRYVVVLTQHGGLYRYLLGDVVEVIGFVGDVPRLEFIERYGNVSSFTGEKLTEPQVLRAIEASARASGIAAFQAVCCPVWGDPPHYTFVVEAALPLSDADASALALRLDAALGEHNDEYPSKRASGRLGPVRVMPVPHGTLTALWDRNLRNAAVPTQAKNAVLQKDDAILRELPR